MGEQRLHLLAESPVVAAGLVEKRPPLLDRPVVDGQKQLAGATLKFGTHEDSLDFLSLHDISSASAVR